VNLDGFALPVKKLKGTDPVEMLDLSGKKLGVASAVVIASLISVNGALTVTNLLHNQLDAESAKMLAEVAKQKGISLCGIRRNQTTADFRNKYLEPADAILLASDLSQAVVTGGLTSLDLSSNQLSLGLDLHGRGTYTAEGITAIADALRVNGGLTALDLSFNNLMDEGVSEVCEAIQNNKETKLASLNFESNRIGPVGANAVAAMVAVNGGLTSINLSGNRLCGVWTDFRGQQGTYTSEGITAIADAMRVNGALIECDLSNNGMGKEGKALILSAAQGKAGFNLHL